ncbi:hypothetical protein [Nostoc sp.]|uniref:hypothetical protein n=1 Tax=Nostoc sp. TaxID=1180 RepID=UPI002FF9CEFE
MTSPSLLSLRQSPFPMSDRMGKFGQLSNDLRFEICDRAASRKEGSWLKKLTLTKS